MTDSCRVAAYTISLPKSEEQSKRVCARVSLNVCESECMNGYSPPAI